MLGKRHPYMHLRLDGSWLLFSVPAPKFSASDTPWSWHYANVSCLNFPQTCGNLMNRRQLCWIQRLLASHADPRIQPLSQLSANLNLSQYFNSFRGHMKMHGFEHKCGCFESLLGCQKRPLHPIPRGIASNLSLLLQNRLKLNSRLRLSHEIGRK